MEFPRLVYRSAADHKLANDQDQFNELIEAGWFSSVPEAVAGKHDAVAEQKAVIEPLLEPVAADDLPPSRSELEEKAGELGIRFDGRTGDSKLAALIAKALEV